jgi:ferrochelatase
MEKHQKDKVTNNTHTKKIVGVILMTYGSATTADGVRGYMERIYGGKASDEIIADFENRYRLVGGSPLISISKEQAEKVEEELNTDSSTLYIVRSGMRHSAPFIKDAVKECRDLGATTMIGIILSPQFSPLIMNGYTTAFNESCIHAGFTHDEIQIRGPWPTEKNFIKLLATRVTESLKDLHATHGDTIPVVFTTHSLPQRVVEKDPDYLVQLQKTTDAIIEALPQTTKDIIKKQYRAYQSAGHTPEVWLKPDLVDILSELKNKKSPAVLIVPIQFLSDHLEILYDLDIAARAQCEAYGIAYHRTELPNTDPLFITSLVNIAIGPRTHEKNI